MNKTLKKVLKAVSVFIAGIATGIVIAEYGENAMYYLSETLEESTEGSKV